MTLPYEFLPLPEEGQKGIALGRSGEEVCEATIVSVKTAKAFDKTNLLKISVTKEYTKKTRYFKTK